MQDHEIALYKQVRHAIKDGRLHDVVSLLAEDQSRLSMDTPFGSWLHMAAAHGKLEIVQWLVSQHAEIDSVGGIGERRPIDEAAAEGHVDVVKALIKAGAKLDVSDSERNPLLSAIVGGLSDSHTAVAKLLIDSGINTSIRYPNLHNMDALEYAREWGRSEIVKLLEANSQ